MNSVFASKELFSNVPIIAIRSVSAEVLRVADFSRSQWSRFYNSIDVRAVLGSRNFRVLAAIGAVALLLYCVRKIFFSRVTPVVPLAAPVKSLNDRVSRLWGEETNDGEKFRSAVVIVFADRFLRKYVLTADSKTLYGQLFQRFSSGCLGEESSSFSSEDYRNPAQLRAKITELVTDFCTDDVSIDEEAEAAFQVEFGQWLLQELPDITDLQRQKPFYLEVLEQFALDGEISWETLEPHWGLGSSKLGYLNPSSVTLTMRNRSKFSRFGTTTEISQ